MPPDESTEVPGYELRRCVASGGMGEVQEGVHRVTGRRVAIKLMRVEAHQRVSIRERFAREVKMLGALEHENIVTILDAGRLDGDRPYLVMDFIDGRSLREVLEVEGPVEPRRAALIARQVARALRHAHAAGVVHRDLKPANIMLEAGSDHVVLIDFGIGRSVVENDDSTDLTCTGALLGTPHYMAPEQARGESDVGSPADCHAFGLVLYEMLTGERAHRGDNRQAILHHVLYHRVSPLPQQLTNTEVGSLVERCLAKDPARRPSANDIVRSLDAFLQNAGCDSSAPTWSSVAADPPPRHWGLAVSAAALIVGVGVGWGANELSARRSQVSGSASMVDGLDSAACEEVRPAPVGVEPETPPRETGAGEDPPLPPVAPTTLVDPPTRAAVAESGPSNRAPVSRSPVPDRRLIEKRRRQLAVSRRETEPQRRQAESSPQEKAGAVSVVPPEVAPRPTPPLVRPLLDNPYGASR